MSFYNSTLRYIFNVIIIILLLYRADNDASQRERLAEQLNKGELECLVCCECIKQNDYTWSCSNCYHVFHLKCIKKWANSSQAGKQLISCNFEKNIFIKKL